MSEQTINDQILGELTWNDDDECWVSQVQFSLEHVVNITVDPEDAETGGVILKARQYFVKLQNQEEINLRCQIAEQMLPIYHKDWSNGDMIDLDIFVDRIKLEDIVFYANATTQLFYNDGNLFAGHGIVATINDQDIYQGASLFG